jgi:DHA2 family multidrug resistance protein
MSAAVLTLVPPAPPRARNKWIVALAVTFGTLMGAIDSSIVNVGLSQIRSSVGATVQEITWISTGYAIAMVMVMPLTAFFGRLFGQKKVYMACLALFIVGSVLCGFAWNLPSLIVFRMMQGFGAGALQPTEQAILRQTFPPKEQGTAMALFAMAVMVGPALGPTLGGAIIDNFHWSWIFFINLPVGLLGFFMVWRFVDEPEDIRLAMRAEAAKQRKNMDWLGIAFLWTALVGLEYVLEEGQSQDWFQSEKIVLLSMLVAFAAVAFVVRELSAPAPAVNLRLFLDPVFASGTLVSASVMAVMMSGMFLLPLFMQELLGFTATQSGMALMPRTLVMVAAMPLIGRFYSRFHPALLGMAGLALTAYGQFLLSTMNLDSNSSHVIVGICVMGVGMALLLVPLQTVVLANIPRHRLSDATGLSSLLRQIGGSMGLAVFASRLSSGGVLAREAMKAHLVEQRPEVFQRLVAVQASAVARGIDPAVARQLSIASMYGLVARQGMVIAFDQMFILGALLFAAVAPLFLFVRRPASLTARDVSASSQHVDVEV